MSQQAQVQKAFSEGGTVTDAGLPSADSLVQIKLLDESKMLTDPVSKGLKELVANKTRFMAAAYTLLKSDADVRARYGGALTIDAVKEVAALLAKMEPDYRRQKRLEAVLEQTTAADKVNKTSVPTLGSFVP